MSRTEVRISGFGGQGVVLFGRMLANAAIFEGKDATQVETYAMQQRGGAVRTDVIISDEGIDYPEITKADILIALSQEAHDTHLKYLKDGGTLLVDPLHVAKCGSGDKATHIYKVPATKIAKTELGNPIVVNVVMLGSLVGLTGLLSEGAVKKAVTENVPAKALDLNLKALSRGFEEGQRARTQI